MPADAFGDPCLPGHRLQYLAVKAVRGKLPADSVGIAARRIVALHYLNYPTDLNNEDLIAAWGESPFQMRLPGCWTSVPLTDTPSSGDN